ncbi:MAG: acyl-CoA dehydrogenase family protein [Intestinimonas sp.]|nr:acyl-CoA dehydrogenase family protein [Intestinimonas sp.]MDY5339480.1 acyl-CoA dehydrogenase family protein [Intestinimonas sp.]
MNFQLNDTQKMMRDLARDFATKELAPIAAEIDQEERIPKEIIEKMAEIGFTALNVPEEYGGPGLDTVCKVLVVSELARQCASTAEVIAVHTLVNDIFLKHGTEAQKQKYLTAAVEGKIGAFALTEAGAGSDAAAAKTKAVVDGDDYVINGSKCFISNMGPTEGDYVVVIALTEPEKGVKGMSAIVVDRGTPGFTVGKREEKMGIRGADISELIFEDCRVPRSNLVGKEGEGFKIAMMALDGGRIGMAAQALGICEAAIAASVKYMGERVQFGKPIGKNQGLQWYLADMATRTEAAKALILEAAVAADNGQPLSKLAAMCKYYASENAVWVTNKALQIHGGYGYMRDYPIERMYRDARIVPIYEGTSEVQKMVIAREVMK